MELTKEQIQHVFDFALQKRVRYKDVQIEVVDHLASAIEELMDKEPGLSFEKALKKVYSTYPITGFANLVGEKEKSMQRFWFRKFWKMLMTYFTPPKILFSVSLFIILFYSLGTYQELIPYILIPLAVFAFAVIVIFLYREYDSPNHQNTYLLVKSFNQTMAGSIWLAYYIPWLMLDFAENINWLSEDSMAWALFYAIGFTLFCMIGHAILFEFPQMLKDEFKRQHLHLMEV